MSTESPDISHLPDMATIPCSNSAEFGYVEYRAVFWVGLGGISHSFDLVLGILAIEGLAKIRSLLYCRSVPKNIRLVTNIVSGKYGRIVKCASLY